MSMLTTDQKGVIAETKIARGECVLELSQQTRTVVRAVKIL